MIFEFKLAPIEEVQPWGNKLHWFAFTQGEYRIKVGSEYLLNSSKEYMNYLTQKYPEYTSATKFIDYYIVRLWEDLMEILPYVLEPVPEELQYFFESNYKTQADWFKKVSDWREKAKLNNLEEDEIWDTGELATYWLQSRNFNNGYLSSPAEIWMWSDENDVIISWDNQEITVDGIQVYSALRGNYRISREKFIKELESFDRKFIAEMKKRTDEIYRNWKNDKVHIDFELLISEQKSRATWMESCLKRDYKTNWNESLRTDWNKVKSAVRLINE